jgi:ABC-2 type transport system ATP-binding protein
VEAVCDHVAIIAAGTLQAVYDVEQVLQSGIEGYAVRVGGVPPGAMSEFIVTEISEGRVDVSVPREHFQEFMEQLFICGGHVLLIEPQRRSLEALFLEIVGRTS